MHTLARRALPLLWGRRTRLKAEPEGGAGHGARCRRRARPVQPQGQGRTDRLGLAPAADARRTSVDEEPYARRPLLARPSAESVLPRKGGGEACGATGGAIRDTASLVYGLKSC